MPALSPHTLDQIPLAVRRFQYDRSALKTGIVHLGLGAFARAHLAEYTDDALEKEFGPWAICGVSMRKADVIAALRPQEGIYTLSVREPGEIARRIIGSVKELRVFPEDPRGLIVRMASPDIRIVTLSVTEKGYCRAPATGELDENHPDIIHDRQNPGAPRSAIGAIAAALNARRLIGAPPFTVMSLDNLAANGPLLRDLVTAFANLVDARLAKWIEENGAFPSTMVDRIVPATSREDLADVAAALGVDDLGAVVAEPYRQWVIEDKFVEGRPAWDKAGAQVVADVAPFETMKLRMLNGAHSSLAYLGYMAGHETVSEASADPALSNFLVGLWREIAPTVSALNANEAQGYADALLARFKNPAIRHRVWQIAMDGSQKLPQRLLGTIRDRLKANAPIDHLATGVAAWMRYVMGVDEKGESIDVWDPLAQRLKEATDAAGRDAAKIVDALLKVQSVFGADLAASEPFRQKLVSALDVMLAKGARAAAEAATRAS